MPNHVEKPSDVYLDQSVFSQIVAGVGTNWRRHEFGAVVSTAADSGKGEVWVSPTHVVETVQADEARRRSLAQVMLEMIDSRRMGIGADGQLVREFFEFIERCAPGGVQRVYVDYHLKTGRQIALGALGLIAATGTSSAGGIVDQLKKHKAINRLMYARFAADPEGVLKQMIKAVDELGTTPQAPLENFDARTTEDINVEADGLVTKIKGIAKDVRRKLDSNRATVSRAYGASEVARYLRESLPLPMELALSFRCPRIIDAWPTIHKLSGGESLPKDIVLAPEDKKVASPDVVIPVIRASVRAAARMGLITGTVAYSVILRELQRMVNDKDIPSGSLTFDADHAAALTWCSVVVTRDEEFAKSLKTIAAELERSCGGQWNPKVCTTSEQLSKALGL